VVLLFTATRAGAKPLSASGQPARESGFPFRPAAEIRRFEREAKALQQDTLRRSIGRAHVSAQHLLNSPKKLAEREHDNNKTSTC
jgi:hypothetical protein